MKKKPLNHESKIRGAFLGALVGDAIGVPYEFEAPRKTKEVVLKGFGTHNQPPGTWSDDGALLLCSAFSLAEKKEFCPHHLSDKFLQWQKEGFMACGNRLFDIGTTTVQAFYRMRQGVSPLEAGGRLFETCGNGSLMRILPHALFPLPKSLEALVSQVHDSSAITHRHPLCQVTCAVYCVIVRELISGTSKKDALSEAASKLTEVYQNHFLSSDYLRRLNELTLHEPNLGKGFVLDTFFSALKACLETKNYKEAIQRAVSFGGDTDTVACVTGGLAGVLYGDKAIPSEWVNSLRFDDLSRQAMDRFIELALSESIPDPK